MTLKKFVLIPVIIGVLACLIQALDQLLYTSVPPEGNVGFSWISFQSWAVYFLAGCTVRGGIKAFIAYAIGIAASIVIMVLGGAMTPALAVLSTGVVYWCRCFLRLYELCAECHFCYGSSDGDDLLYDRSLIRLYHYLPA